MDEIGLMGDIFTNRRRRMAHRLRSFGITLSQFYLIQLARKKGAISPSAAAEGLSCDRPTATLVAQKCVAGGWLNRKRSKRDRRSALLTLSGQGEELLDRIESAQILLSTSLGDPLDVLAPEEAEAFRSSLAKVLARSAQLYSEGGAGAE
jgi:DNA-binding MarR family transcriptional regulator